MISEQDKEVLNQGKPYIRSILAFLAYLRFGPAMKTTSAYTVADHFIKQLEEDLNDL